MLSGGNGKKIVSSLPLKTHKIRGKTIAREKVESTWAQNRINSEKEKEK